jgi:hypothetical protein
MRNTEQGDFNKALCKLAVGNVVEHNNKHNISVARGFCAAYSAPQMTQRGIRTDGLG